jgi:hypothetical protein
VEGLDLSLIELLIHTGGSHMSHGHMTGSGSQGYLLPVYESNTGNSLNYLTGLRSHFVNHSCDANAAKIIDQDYFVRIEIINFNVWYIMVKLGKTVSFVHSKFCCPLFSVRQDSKLFKEH